MVTKLDPSAVAQEYLSVQGLQRLIAAGIHVQHADRLHAKCFIIGTKGMLGSANLTGQGLGSVARANRELGVQLHAAQVAQARRVISRWPSREVSVGDLSRLQEMARTLTRAKLEQHEELGAVSAPRLAEALLVDATDPDRRLWLKLEYGKPALDGWRQRSWFASPGKGKPSFTPGDLVLICAKDTHDSYAVVEVLSEPEYRPDDYVEWARGRNPEGLNRWPWINRTRPRLVPSELMGLKIAELGVRGQGLQNGHVRLTFEQFRTGVMALVRVASD